VNKPVYASKHRMTPLVTTKILRLGDSPIGTNSYATLAAGETDCRTKEAMPMRSEDSTPANRRPLAALCVMLAVLSVFVGLAAILGPGRTIYQVGTYLIPMVVIQLIAVSLAHSCVGDECFPRRPHIKDEVHRRAKHAKQ
jgi:hypothetical protein